MTATTTKAKDVEPVGEGPSDEQILAMRSWSSHGPTLDSDLVDFSRAVLARWGRPATPPAPAGNHIPDATEMVAYSARLRHCPTHGQQPAITWGCPECLRELRDELAWAQSRAIGAELVVAQSFRSLAFLARAALAEPVGEGPND